MEDCSTLLSFYQFKCAKCDPHCYLSVCGSWAGLCLWSLDAADSNHGLTVTGQGPASCWAQLGHHTPRGAAPALLQPAAGGHLWSLQTLLSFLACSITTINATILTTVSSCQLDTVP